MQAEVHWITNPEDGGLAIMPHPRGDEWLSDELASLREQGATLIVSLLEKEQAEGLGLADEEQACATAGLRFRHFPIVDHDVPPLEKATFDFIKELAGEVRAGEGVAVHCMAGIGRSGLICCAVLVALGLVPVEAMRVASEARGLAVPETEEQCLWLRDYAQQRKPPEEQSTNSD
jgi:protein-tyrosine phosphatase